MTDQFVFVTGMFRSGTTLLARMLNAHSQVALASDPFARLFRAFRNEIAMQALPDRDWDSNAPLDDYYFYADKQKMLQQIQNATLEMTISASDLASLKVEIANASRPFSPKLEKYLTDLQGETFAELLKSGLNLIQRAYGTKNTVLLGMKEVWTGEFANIVLRQFSKAKVIHMVRDPRAVCASKNVKASKYPWLFLARHWRKQATFAWLDQFVARESDRVLVVKFEDLISDSVQEIQKICTFLDVEFQKNLLNPAAYVDGNGNPWYQNSSHFSAQQQFNPDSVNKWKSVLKAEEVEFIEMLCFAEMLVFGYEPLASSPVPERIALLFSPPQIESESLAPWIRPYSVTSKADMTREMALEYMRNQVLSGDGVVEDNEKQRLCLHTDFFDVARKSLHAWRK